MSLEDCPECKGDGFVMRDPNPVWHDDPETALPLIKYKCHACKGMCQFNKLDMQLYKLTLIPRVSQ